MQWQMELVSGLTAADSSGERTAILERYAVRTGMSLRNLYRVAAKHGYRCERKQRADKGEAKCGLTDEQFSYLAGLIYVTGRENKGPIMPIEEAIGIAEDNGIIEPGQVSPSTVARQLRERQLSKAQMNAPEPHTEMRSLHPNYCHLVDVSVCIQYYLKNGRLGIMDERDFYKNKPDSFAKVKQKLMRYVLTDHFSGLYVWRYYIADGESRENLWDFLKWAWAPSSDSRLPFQGVPFYLLMDAGSAQKSHAMQNFFKGLLIITPKGKPYNPRRQGGVETIHNVIENRFETRLRLQPAYSVEELNAWAMDYAIYHHTDPKRSHSRHGMTRLEAWLLIKQEQLRLLPDDPTLNLLYAEPEKECTVRNYRISYRGEEFNLKSLPDIHHNAKVMVSINPYRWQAEHVVMVSWQGETYELQSIAKLPATLGGFSANAAIIGQEYKAQPETNTQKAIKEIKERAYGTREPKKGAVPYEGTVVFGIHADKVPNLATMPKKGHAIELARPEAPASVPILELFKRLRGADITVTLAMNSSLREQYGATITLAEIDRVIHSLQGGGAPQQAEERPALRAVN